MRLFDIRLQVSVGEEMLYCKEGHHGNASDIVSNGCLVFHEVLDKEEACEDTPKSVEQNHNGVCPTLGDEIDSEKGNADNQHQGINLCPSCGVGEARYCNHEDRNTKGEASGLLYCLLDIGLRGSC